MGLIDEYKTISSPSEGFFKDKGSKFFAYLFPVASEEEVTINLDLLKLQHSKARHHCYAYRMEPEGGLFRANDDGEPSGSAGKPILNALLSAELTNCLLIVVRYFGGTLLGVSGLINAYKTAAEDAIMQAKIESLTVNQKYQVAYDFPDTHNVMRIVKDLDLKVLKQDYTTTNILEFEARLSLEEPIFDSFKEYYKVELKKL